MRTCRVKTQTPVFIDFVLKLTFFNKVNGKLFGSRICALQLEVAPGEQAALDRPEEGEENRANLRLGLVEHQQFTLQGRRQRESVYKAIHRTQPWALLKTAAVTGISRELGTVTKELSTQK